VAGVGGDEGRSFLGVGIRSGLLDLFFSGSSAFLSQAWALTGELSKLQQ